MSAWICCPSARPVEDVSKWAAAWRERGYRVAIMRDDSDKRIEPISGVNYEASSMGTPLGKYPGYATAVNVLVHTLITDSADAEWFIIAGDDVFPDPNHTADEIAAQCADHFAILGGTGTKRTFGVMQPAGDRWGEERRGVYPAGSAYIDRVAGSAWVGREFAKRINQGHGPLWPEYFHMGVDEELQAVATKLGVFWQRRDLMHHHAHWARDRARSSDMPAFLAKANSSEEWSKYKALYAKRAREGFPGSEPL